MADDLFHTRLDDFFVGIGDINAAGLPKQTGLVPPPFMPAPPATPPLTPASTDSSVDTSPTTPPPATAHLVPPLPTTPGSDLAEVVVEASKEALAEAIEAQVEERPLAKAQEVLETQAQEAEGTAGTEGADDATTVSDQSASVAKVKPRALLNNDDDELARVLSVSELSFCFSVLFVQPD